MPRLSTSAHAADRKLVKGLNEGDEAALAALYDEYGERLYDYVLSMSGDGKAAADIVHDAFIDACRRAPRMRDHLYLSSWLYGAARRRCIRRGRPKVLFFDRDAEFSDAPFLDRADTADPAPVRPSSDELHGLLRACLARLEPVDQEVMLLAYRHDLRPVRLGAALGLSGRRAAARVRRARVLLDAALRREIERARRDCAAAARATEESRSAAIPVLAARAPARPVGDPPEEPGARGLRRFLRRRGEEFPADPATDLHAAGCDDCRARAGVTAAALLRRAPAPVLPAALRHRVMHTATDPELAGYRADIAARGGALTPSGLPSQPDVSSPYTRRWLFTGGGMVGALAAAVVAALVMGPGIGGGPLSWPPFRTHPAPSITQERPGGQGNGKGGPEGPGGGAQARPGQPPPDPQTHEKNREKPEDPVQPSQPPPATESPKPPGVLVVSPAKVEMYGTKTAQVSLKAKSGPVSWTAMTSSNQLILSSMQGGMPEDGTTHLTLTLRTALVGLPGQGTLTFTDSEGAAHQVKVVWGATLL
ncbi:RNA polymerase sigma factor [Actinomadura sp. WMMA1423]|uniref:RNA polymerase sigma factor n=1 Tax=Actinomadura sp. WMMA1423 TaxID=2591108 RepID=UPI0011474A91|nr:sigma-70 family RNA polymerase sigma factor [Actinomadura sp. WMMA1423]